MSVRRWLSGTESLARDSYIRSRSGPRVRMDANATTRTARLFTLFATYSNSPAPDEAGMAEGGLGEYVDLEQDLEPAHNFSNSIARSAWVGMPFSKGGEVWAEGVLYLHQ